MATVTAGALSPVPAAPTGRWFESQRAAHDESLRIRRMRAVQAGVRAEWEFAQTTREWDAQRRQNAGPSNERDDYAD